MLPAVCECQSTQDAAPDERAAQLFTVPPFKNRKPQYCVLFINIEIKYTAHGAKNTKGEPTF